MTKICKKCLKEKDISQFHKQWNRKDGTRTSCKDCCIEYSRKYRIINAEIIKRKNREYYQNNTNILIERRKRSKKYYHKNAEKIKVYRENNRQLLRKRGKEYRLKNINKIKIKQSLYYLKNKRKILNRRTHRYNTNINVRLLDNLRSRLCYLTRESRKIDKTIKLLGCSIEEFRKYLESKFQPGMTWENHGLYGWHIDHIKPCASFDLTNPEEQAKCFHFSNLQPLWARDNWKKNKYGASYV